MPKICYEEKRLNRSSLAIVSKANEIIGEYAEQGFTLTLRQLYYQFVARGLIENTLRSYKRLGSIVNDGRLCGLIDWNAIEDRTRWLRQRASWDGPADIVEACASQFHVDHWAGQRHRPEVWIEKDALVGVVEGVCEELDVPFFACRGYVSQSEQWRAGMRHARHFAGDQETIIFHLGDHDPSGLDMTRDNAMRLGLFTSLGYEVRRLALNMDQVQEYEPPPNPAKITDSRYESYAVEHGTESWELDALEPAVIAALIRSNVEALIDPDPWAEAVERERAGRERLRALAAELGEE